MEPLRWCPFQNALSKVSTTNCTLQSYQNDVKQSITNSDDGRFSSLNSCSFIVAFNFTNDTVYQCVVTRSVGCAKRIKCKDNKHVGYVSTALLVFFELLLDVINFSCCIT